MRKSELKVGEEYAVGGTASHDRWRMSRAVIESLDGEALDRYNQLARGIVLRFPDGGGAYPFRTVKPGEARSIDSARNIQCPWVEYEQAKAEFDARQAEVRAEKDRAMRVSNDAAGRLVVLGATCTRSGSDFRFSADQMARLLAMIPDA